ncbi:MAG TPA: hypothetical protein VF556_09925 [Pyrinomonadaceae bacterium]
MEKIISALLVLVGAINFYPVIGVLSAQTLTNLYLIDVQSGDILILLRHRAILFGILGAFIIYSAFKPEFQWLAITFGLISMLSFIVITFLVGDYGAGIRKVIIADVVASILLIIVISLRWFVQR